jgi:hypothetical protein
MPRASLRIAVLAAVLAALLATPAAAAPNPFFGVKAWAYHPTQAELQRLADAGVGTYKLDLLWGKVEPFRRWRQWGEYDQIVADASRAGVALFPTLFSSPPWAARNPLYPPRTRATRRAWLRFVRDAVRRYGRRGTFWRTHQGVPYHPITAWQVWNEPNYPAYWFKRPNARQYAAFLKITGRAIHGVDRRATVVAGGLPESRHGIPITTFLAGIYRYPGARIAFDAVAIHPYAVGAPGVQGAISRVRAVMRHHGDARKQLWITELGWATGGPPNPFTTTARGQADRLTATYRMLLRHRRAYKLGIVVWFSLRDRGLFPGEKDWWAPHTGLFDRRGRPKPAWDALASLAGGVAGTATLAPANGARAGEP